MLRPSIALRGIVLFLLLGLTLFLVFAFDGGRAEGRAPGQTAATATPMADSVGISPRPPYLSNPLTALNPSSISSVSPNLSYYFISGNTFSPDAGSSPYLRQGTGCVNQMPSGSVFSAPVNLPQASQVVSITLYSYDSAITTTVSTAYFIVNDGKGSGGYTVSASSLPNTSGYQQHDSTQNNPLTIDNQNYNYRVQWGKFANPYDSPYLSLCGVRVAYHAPLDSTLLPLIMK